MSVHASLPQGPPPNNLLSALHQLHPQKCHKVLPVLNVTRTFCVFRLFRLCDTRRFVQTLRQARYRTGLCLYMRLYCGLENVFATFKGIRRDYQKSRWRLQMDKRKKVSRAARMDKISRGRRSYNRKSVYRLESCRLHRSDWKIVQERYDMSEKIWNFPIE